MYSGRDIDIEAAALGGGRAIAVVIDNAIRRSQTSYASSSFSFAPASLNCINPYIYRISLCSFTTVNAK